MKKENSRNIRLGLVVLLGTTAIIAALYYVGSRQRLFGSTVRIKAEFYNVNGLRRGNSVRFTGIDIGTVESIEITSDTSVLVTMAIDSDACRFLRKDAVAYIGTDGVMGNKLININTSRSVAPLIENGDKLRTLKTVEMDVTFRTLNNTNDNLNAVSADLRAITEKLNSNQSVLNLLLDRSVSENLRSTVAHFRYTGENTAVLTGDLRAIVQHIQDGKGTAGLLLTDTAFRNNMANTAIKMRMISDSLAVISGDFQSLTGTLKNGEGLVSVLFTDTAYVRKMDRILENLENGSGNLDENMVNLRQHWPFKPKKKKT
jgi:phospholipid/cholesterol/gamma-HCH transport system substrate-binding protein